MADGPRTSLIRRESGVDLRTKINSNLAAFGEGPAVTDVSSDLSIVTIVPLYNGARWIEQSIASVLSQTLQPDEFIVVDDGSTDEGSAVVEKWARNDPIRLLRKPNGGQSSARGACHRAGPSGPASGRPNDRLRPDRLALPALRPCLPGQTTSANPLRVLWNHQKPSHATPKLAAA
jgi:cellulose synthase/poly-beta-1,6-N-acetylglucosamine synthase-like glycosyltransferase